MGERRSEGTGDGLRCPQLIERESGSDPRIRSGGDGRREASSAAPGGIHDCWHLCLLQSSWLDVFALKQQLRISQLLVRQASLQWLLPSHFQSQLTAGKDA
ncbi:hypothetical protein ACRRTK_001333 [Alexandromys fortis]